MSPSISFSNHGSASSLFSQRLKQIKENLRKISHNLNLRSQLGQHHHHEQENLVAIQGEIAALVVLFPRIEKLLIQLESSSLHRLAKLLRMGSKQQELTMLFEYIEMAIEVLSHEHPSVLVARKIRIDIERTVNCYQHPIMGVIMNRFMDVYRSESDPLKVVCGLAFTSSISALLFFGGLIGISLQQESGTELLEVQERLFTIKAILEEDGVTINENGELIPLTPNALSPNNGSNSLGSAIGQAITTDNHLELAREYRTKRLRLNTLEKLREQERQDASILFLIVLVVSSGTLGSAISILIRINDFEKQDATDPIVPIFTGAFKPIIGSSFGLLVYAMFSSGIISVQIVPPTTARGAEFFFCSLAFVVGFSERLAKDVIKRTEDQFLGAEPAPLPPPMASHRVTYVEEQIAPPEELRDHPSINSPDYPQLPKGEDQG